MLQQNLLQNTIQACNPPARIRAIKLKRQDSIVPGDFRTKRHGVSFKGSSMPYRPLYRQAIET